jgi:hypothetical protein
MPVALADRRLGDVDPSPLHLEGRSDQRLQDDARHVAGRARRRPLPLNLARRQTWYGIATFSKHEER